MSMDQKKYKRHWRFYRTQSGHSPVRDFLSALADEDAGTIADTMKEVVEEGTRAARHLRGEMWEVRQYIIYDIYWGRWLHRSMQLSVH